MRPGRALGFDRRLSIHPPDISELRFPQLQLLAGWSGKGNV